MRRILRRSRRRQLLRAGARRFGAARHGRLASEVAVRDATNDMRSETPIPSGIAWKVCVRVRRCRIGCLIRPAFPDREGRNAPANGVRCP